MTLERSALAVSPFLDIYSNDFKRVAGLYSWNPQAKEDWQTRSGQLQKRFADPDYRNRLADALLTYNESIGAGASALTAIEQIRNGALTIVTGQQAGLLTGPLYTIYKALTAELLARDYEQQLQVPVVPVFWIASEDHDFLEVNHIFVQTGEAVTKIEWSLEQTNRRSIGNLPVPEAEVRRLLREIEAHTMETEFRSQVLQSVYDAWKSTDNMADWFGAILAKVFENGRLVFLNPMLPEFRQLVAHVFIQAIEMNEALRDAALHGAEQVRACGFEPQVHVMEHSSLLFIQLEDGRFPLDVIDGRFVARGTENSWTNAELLQLVRNHPERMSSNVLLRPVVQDHLLPVLAYVGGGAEVAYHGMLKELFTLYGIDMPVVVPRISATIIEKTIAKYLRKYGVTADSIMTEEDPLRSFLASLDDVGVDSLFAEFQAQIDVLYKELTEGLVKIDPQLQNLSQENKQSVQHRVESLRQKALQFHQQKHEIAVRQMQKVITSLQPNHHLQERVFNIFPYLIKYGVSFVDQLRLAFPNGDHANWYVYL